MRKPGTDLSTRMELALDPSAAFDAFIEELITGLAGRGMRFHPGAGGRVTQGGRVVARVVDWEPGTRVGLEWRPAERESDPVIRLEIRFESVSDRTRVSINYHGCGDGLKLEAPELAGWFAQAVAAPLLQATSPASLGDWITDRQARRPSGAAARQGYRDPTFHKPNFKLLLAALALSRDDYLLEVGCGGGAFLHDALRVGCRAAALDHSPEMVRLARAENRGSVDEGRFEAVQAEADRIPFAEGRFTCVVTTNVFGFIDHPVAALSEIHRVLVPGGRLLVFTISRELVGTPAAPEPMASRLHFYEDEELRRMALEAGFADARVDRPDLEPFAREAGLTEDQVAHFRGGRGCQLLTARKG